MPSYLITEHEYSIDNGVTWQDCTAKPLSIPNSNIPAGHVQVRVKATSGRNAGAILYSDAPFTMSFVDVPDTFPTINTLYTQVNGNSLIAAEGDDATKTIWTRLSPMLAQSGKTILGQQFGVNGVRSSVMLQSTNMTNMVYNPYYQNGGDLKVLLAYEYTNELSALIGGGMTSLQAAQEVYNQMKEFCEKARNKDNSNSLFLQPGGAPANSGDGYRVGIVLPLDCARTGHRTAITWLRTEIAANYRQFANFLVDLTTNPYIGTLGVAGVEGGSDRNDYYKDGTHHTEIGELIFSDGMRKATFDYLSWAMPTDISSLTASLSSGTVTASVTSISAIEYRIKVGTGAWSNWQGHGVFTGVSGTIYTVEARMIYKPAAILTYSTSYEAETTAHISKVQAISGAVLPDTEFLNSFIVHAKTNNYWNDVIWAGGTTTGYYSTAGLVTAIGINSINLNSASGTTDRTPDIVNNIQGRPVFEFEGEITMGENDLLANSLTQVNADRINGTQSITMVALAKAENRTTSYGQAVMNFGDVGDFYIGTDTAGAFVVRRNTATASATTSNTEQQVLLSGRFNGTTKDMDVWVGNTKEATTNITTPYNISSSTSNLCIGSGLHTLPLQGQVEFGFCLASAPSDTLMQSIQNFLLTELPI